MSKKEYKELNITWLADKSKEEGVSALPGGVLYKVITSGAKRDKHPTPRSVVTVHYSGRTIDGKEFDNSRTEPVPVAMRLSDLIDGWIIAIQQMCVGDRWEIYLPANLAYGKFSQPGIPAHSTLIFDIELFGIA